MAKVLAEALKCIGRLAPSPTGALHLGNIRTFMIAWLSARSKGGKVVMRMEDLDHPRDKIGAADAIYSDLRWLGFDWDELFVQSKRRDIYRQALKSLDSLVYPCVCSRKDVESAQSAPHQGEQLYYPGTCRERFRSWDEAYEFKKAKDGSLPCWRFRVDENTVVGFDDKFCGYCEFNVSKMLGDFPLARDIDGAGYTFACTVDDILMGVTEVVRADDLLNVTPAQILISNALKAKGPSYCHVPLVIGRDGRRLAKRHGDTRIERFRAEGVRVEQIIGYLGYTCGWCQPGEELSLEKLIPRFSLASIPKERVVCLASEEKDFFNTYRR